MRPSDRQGTALILCIFYTHTESIAFCTIQIHAKRTINNLQQEGKDPVQLI